MYLRAVSGFLWILRIRRRYLEAFWIFAYSRAVSGSVLGFLRIRVRYLEVSGLGREVRVGFHSVVINAWLVSGL